MMMRPSTGFRFLALSSLLLGVGHSTLCGQQPPAPAPAPGPQAAPPAIIYQLDAPQRDPAHFTLTIDLVGRAVYEAQEDTGDTAAGQSETGPSAASPAEASGAPYRAQFDVSPGTRDRIFAIAQQLDYFHGDYEFRKHRVADTGLRTVTYRDGMRQSETSFHWSDNKQIQELENIFEGIAATQAFGRRLAYVRRYDKLGLEALLKRMEEMDRSGYLGELQAIAPLLRQIATDQSVLHVARERAQRLLDRIPPQPAGAK